MPKRQPRSVSSIAAMMVNVEGRAVNEIEAEEADALAMAICKWEVVYSCRKGS